MNPVPSYGGNVCCTGNAVQGGAFDQRKMEARPDILVYSTEPLKQGIEVSGPIEVTLYISSDAVYHCKPYPSEVKITVVKK